MCLQALCLPHSTRKLIVAACKRLKPCDGEVDKDSNMAWTQKPQSAPPRGNFTSASHRASTSYLACALLEIWVCLGDNSLEVVDYGDSLRPAGNSISRHLARKGPLKARIRTLRSWPRSRFSTFRRDPPDRAGTSNIGSAARIGARTERRPTENFPRNRPRIELRLSDPPPGTRQT